MGLFNRTESGATRSGRARPSVSSEAQAAELRGRARRRLAGAVALVLAAVVVLPMVLDGERHPVSEDIPVQIPDRTQPFDPNMGQPQAGAPQASAQPPVANGVPATAPGADGGVPTPPPLTSGAPPAVGTPAPAATAAPHTPSVQVPSAAVVRPEATPKPPVETAKPATPAPKPATPTERSDDGARALALLEGRTPTPAESRPKPAAASNKGNFVLQIAAYTTQGDAQGRRDKLHAAGVTNAFVEPASIGGKQQFRLRVGPFPSRDAAQAAQARLRTLGYDNGFIAAQ